MRQPHPSPSQRWRRRSRKRAGLLSSWCHHSKEAPRMVPFLLLVAPKFRGMWYPRQSVCEGVRHFFKYTTETSAGLGLFVK